MSLPKLKPLLLIALKTVLIASVITAGYYFVYLKPRLALPNAFRSAQTTLATLHTNLLQNRLALTELTRLNPQSDNFVSEKSRLLETLKTTNQQGLSLLSQSPSVPTVNGTPNQALTFLNQDLTPALADLTSNHQALLKQQQNLIDTITQVDSLLTNAFLYSPSQDLGDLDISQDQDQLISRSQSAIQGLSTLFSKLQSAPLNPADISEIQSSIKQAQETLIDFVNDLQTRSPGKAEKIRQRAINQFALLKRQALTTELSLIRAPQTVTLLTTQTNLINQYQFWINQTSQQQEQLSTSSK